MKTLTIDFPGLSLLDVREQYKHLFYRQDWYDTQDFAKEVIPAGVYELSFPEEMYGKTFAEQMVLLGKEQSAAAPVALVAYAVLSHFKETGERLLEYKFVRSDRKTSGDVFSCVGFFGGYGLSVDYWDGDRYDLVGMGAARKVSESRTLDSSSSLEARVSKIEKILDWHKLRGV